MAQSARLEIASLEKRIFFLREYLWDNNNGTWHTSTDGTEFLSSHNDLDISGQIYS